MRDKRTSTPSHRRVLPRSTMSPPTMPPIVAYDYDIDPSPSPVRYPTARGLRTKREECQAYVVRRQRKATTTAVSGGRSTRSRCNTTPGSVASSTLLGTAGRLTVCGAAAKLAATAQLPRRITTY
jgi:hypothetical protein